MMYQSFRFIAAVIVGLLTSGAAMAHVGVHSAGGFTAGFVHPFIGLDHLLAMVAVGVWAMQLGGRRLLVIPAAFVLTMAAGALAGAQGVALPQVETLVALSVLALGALVALAARARWYWAVALVALFAVSHGYAHGAEMPGFASPWLYLAGLTIATAALHALGIAAGAALLQRPLVLRGGGTAIGLIGFWLVLAA